MVHVHGTVLQMLTDCAINTVDKVGRVESTLVNANKYCAHCYLNDGPSSWRSWRRVYCSSTMHGGRVREQLICAVDALCVACDLSAWSAWRLPSRRAPNRRQTVEKYVIHCFWWRHEMYIEVFAVIFSLLIYRTLFSVTPLATSKQIGHRSASTCYWGRKEIIRK